jgi:GH35 family endo-1,4-beta-xylanase
MKKFTLFKFITVGLLLFSSGMYAQLAKCKGKYLGNIIAGTVHSNYTSLWNQTTSENGSKWGSVHRGTNNYSWGNSDLAYNTAKNSGGLFKFHALIWGAQAPGFLANSSPAQIETAIRQWFQAVQDHYDPMGGLKLIDVLNEPVNTPINREIPNLKAALTLGYQNEPANANDKNNPYGWAIWPFQLARKHFPNAELLINEFNTEHNWNNCRAEYIKMSNAIKNAPNLTDGKKNIIDGIGLQAHGMNGQLNLSAANYKACLDEIWSKTNLPLHITELDLVAEPNEAAQRTKYQEFFTISWEHPHVAGVTLWGYIQGATWIPGNRVSGAGGTDSGIQYANLTDRPAMTWLKEYMASRPSLSCCPAPAPFANCTNSGNPVVSLTAPLNNAVFTAPATINLTATASDPNGTISKVEFYNGTTKLGEDATSPYSYSWANVAKGSYTITAVATDNSGNKTTSTAAMITVNVPQGPYNGTWNLIPGTIQAENYDVGGNGSAYSDGSAGNTGGATFRTDEDVDIENCTDAGAGYNIGYATAGEWLEYSVDVQKYGLYDVSFRVAASGDARTLSLAIGEKAIATNLAIPNTAGWQTWQTVTVKNVTLQPGKQILRLTIGATDYVNINYLTFALVKEIVQEPYKGTAHQIPGRIEAEEYDLGGEGLAYHEGNTSGNQGLATLRNDEVDIETTGDVDGMYNIGYTLTGEWLEYSVNVSATGKYDMEFRVAKDGTGGLFHVEMDGVNVTGSITVPNTGGWQVWQTVKVPNINLTKGAHIMKVVFDSDYMNFNYVEIKDTITGIDDNQLSQIQLYPNPFTSEGLQIELEGNFEYKISDVNGNMLEKGEVKDNELVGQDLSSGIYFITIEQAMFKKVYKLVKL